MKVIFQRAIEFKYVVLHLGLMYTRMAYLAILGKHFLELGLCDLLVESNVVASCSLSEILKGCHLKHAITSHKIVMEAVLFTSWCI